MRAVVCTEYGSHKALHIDTVPEPVAADGQVVLEVHAASLNFPDLLVIKGLYQFRPEPPFVPGMEGAGVVAAIGRGVEHVRVGDRVAAVGVSGAFAERWAVDAASVTPIPADVDFTTASALTLAYGTAYHALNQRANLRHGEYLLVLGAAGGVGSASIEIGKAMGAKVIAVASTDAKIEFCRSLGADATINSSTEDVRSRMRELTDGHGADVIVDPVGGDLTEQAFRSVAWNGRHLVVGFAAGDIPKLPLNLTLLKGASLVGVFWGAFTTREADQNTQNTAALFAMLSSGVLRPRVTSVHSLDGYEEAFDRLATREAKGKVVLRLREGR